MEGSRKSCFGFGTRTRNHGVKPVRIDTLGLPGTSRKSRSPLGGPLLGSCKRVKPIRESDVKELNAIFSTVKKNQDANKRKLKSPKTRRCLYKENEFKTPGAKKKIENTMQGPIETKGETKTPRISRSNNLQSRVADSQEANSKLPVQAHVRRALPSKNIRKPSLRPTPSLQEDLLREMTSVLDDQKKVHEAAQSVIESQREVLEEAQRLINEQKNMLQEARCAFSSFLQDQKLIAQEMKSIIMEQKQKAKVDFTELERKFQNEQNLLGTEPASPRLTSFQPTLPVNKENSLLKSVAAYRDMRKSFPCLVTPKLSARKSKAKTPRSMNLSAKVKAQLEKLLDE